MKKSVIPFMLFVFAIGSSAQEYKIGVYAEPAGTWLSPQSRKVSNQAAAFGFGGGLTFDYYFADNYAFASGIGLSFQGGTLQYEDSIQMYAYDEQVGVPANTDIQYKLNYVNIPLGIKLKTNQIGYFTYFVDLGFDMQINLSAKANTSAKVHFTDGTTDYLDMDQINDEINFVNLGYHFGGGAEYEISESTALFFGMLYRNGFTDITDQKATINSRVIALKLGIIF